MKTLVTILICALALCSCSDGTPSQILQQAEKAVTDGNFQEARLCCKSLDDSVRYHLTPSELCREAIIYAYLSEWEDNPNDMAAATKCYDKAMEISPDSVQAFASTLDIVSLATLNVIHNVGQAINSPADMMHELYEEGDENDEAIDSVLPHEPKTL